MAAAGPIGCFALHEACTGRRAAALLAALQSTFCTFFLTTMASNLVAMASDQPNSNSGLPRHESFKQKGLSGFDIRDGVDTEGWCHSHDVCIEQYHPKHTTSPPHIYLAISDKRHNCITLLVPGAGPP